MYKPLLIIILFISFSSFSQTPFKWGVDESKHMPVGLVEGDVAPDFNVASINADSINLKELIKKGKVVVLFYRGQWCPVCDRYLSNFQDSVRFILDRGISVVAITPETSDNAKMMIEKTKMTFSVVTDQEGEIMKKYDVLFNVTEEYQNKIINKFNTDIADNNGRDEAMLPVPATYIINQNGIIEKVFFNYNYKIRATVGQILKAL